MANKSLLSVGEGHDHARLHLWYKERRHTRYLRDTKTKQQISGGLDTSRWRFLQSGLDDFRDGYPTAGRAPGFTRPQRETYSYCYGNIGPTCDSDGNSIRRSQKRLTKEQAYLSRQNPLRQARRDAVGQVECSLSQHPLALYAHLKESIPAELFIEVASLLALRCPEMDRDKEEHLASDPSSQHERGPPDPSPSGSARCQPGESRPRNPYIWKPGGLFSKPLKTPGTTSLDEDIQTAIQRLCSFIASLPGESSSLDETTLLDLFDSGYERKQLHAVTIQVVSLSSVPDESHCSLEDRRKVMTHNIVTDQDTAETSWKQVAGEDAVPQDGGPFHSCLEDEKLKQLHVTQAFRQFIHHKGLREPRFLRSLFLNEEQDIWRARSFKSTPTST